MAARAGRAKAVGCLGRTALRSTGSGGASAGVVCVGGFCAVKGGACRWSNACGVVREARTEKGGAWRGGAAREPARRRKAPAPSKTPMKKAALSHGAFDRRREKLLEIDMGSASR